MANIETLKNEIDRAFRVLGADVGLQQNAVDITAWRKDGVITDAEYHDLRKYNRRKYSELPLDM